MTLMSIESLAQQALNVFVLKGYTIRSIQEKKNVMQKIILFHKQHGYDCYNPEVIAQFLSNVESRYQEQKISKLRFQFYKRTAFYLTQFNEIGRIDCFVKIVPTNLSSYYEEILAHLSKNDSWNSSNKSCVRSFSVPHFKWLMKCGITSLDQVTEQTVRKYCLDCSSRMKPNSIDTTKRALKKLYRYLFESGLCKEDFSRVLSFSVPLQHKIKKPVPQDEIVAVLNIIDRNTAIGKRDYAIILLGTVTGMRAVDIANLNLEAIDWNNGQIRITQSKTGKMLSLPLTKDIGVALQDYILNGRPKSDLPSVFLYSRAPYAKLSSGQIYVAFNRYRQKIGLPKCSFHGLRRALGTNLVVAGIPITTVSQILGHSSIEPTKQYISLDSIHLKECALDLNGFMPSLEGEKS